MQPILPGYYWTGNPAKNPGRENDGVKILSCLLLASLPALLPGQENVSVPDWERLYSGEIMAGKITDSNSVPGIQVSFLIHASRQEIWSMLTDYDNFRNIYGGIDSLRVIFENQEGARIEVFQTAFVKRIHYILDRNYLRDGYELTWEMYSGDLDLIHGSWLIRDSPYPGHLLMVYSNFFRYGGIVPTKLIRNWSIRQVREMADNAREWIEMNRELYHNVPG